MLGKFIKPLSKFLKLKRRRGLTLVEVLTSLVIIAITATSVTIGFYTSHTMLEIEKRKHLAIKFLEEEMEYWRLRVHNRNISPRDYSGNEHNPREMDFSVFGNNFDKDVTGYVYLVGIEPYDDIRTSAPVDYYKIKCRASYEEKQIDPNTQGRARPQHVVLELSSIIVPANI